MMEQLAARWVLACSMLLISAFSLIRFLPSPTTLPEYARFLPIDLSAEQIVGASPEVLTTAEAPATPTLPATVSGIATIKVQSANCRAKPRGGAERVTYLYKDQQVEILGRNEDLVNPWWYIKIPNSGGNCWLWSMTATLNGNIEDIPIIR